MTVTTDPMSASTLVGNYYDIVSEQVADNLVIRLHGEFDPVSADALRQRIAEDFGDGIRNIVFDCSETTFMDSSALRVLLEARVHAHGHGGIVTVRRPTPPVRRVIEASGLHAVLTVTDLPPR